MSCNCAEIVNENMAEAGKGGSELRLTMPLDGGPRRPMLECGRRGEPHKKPLQGNPQFVQPTYCPFCGERYQEPDKGEQP